jgi:hypothetical protein
MIWPADETFAVTVAALAGARNEIVSARDEVARSGLISSGRLRSEPGEAQEDDRGERR